MIPPWIRAVLPPVLIGLLLTFLLREPIRWWLRGEEIYDQENMREWIREARAPASLPDLTRRYLDLASQRAKVRKELKSGDDHRKHLLGNELLSIEQRLEEQREEMLEHLQTLGSAPTKMYSGQLPLFPVVYRLALSFDDEWDLRPIIWDSQLPRQKLQYRALLEPIVSGSHVEVQYRLHAYQQRHFQERQEATRRLLVGGIGLMLAVAMLLWFVLVRRQELAREHERLVVEQTANAAERRRLEEEIRRQDAERKHQEAERINLELKSQLFANIGIMAGSYAHNIKNLLVRPNDLLRRCLADGLSNEERGRMLQEVKQTLGTVTERLQQILQTVRRDPTKSEMARLDLNALVAELHRTWTEMSQDKWKMQIRLELDSRPLLLEGDASNLQQAFENLLFNARDATFEMRTRFRAEARKAGSGPHDPARREAMISAAAWKGETTLRTRREGGFAILEVQDNGIGMTDDVRQRCLETQFSTKRDNALFAGMTAGMGLGLSFVQAILEHHKAAVEIESQPLQGACFRIRFPLAKDAATSTMP
ncbi:MAG: HAMP domain-containing histidine kinase [Gemmataceae bacterium]|nr:HAMP domain-containing histidine kinase [Gemmataceae bacterium]